MFGPTNRHIAQVFNFVPQIHPRHPLRVAVVTNCIPQYRYPVFKRVIADTPSRWRFFLSSSSAQTCTDAQRNLPITFCLGLNPQFRNTLHRVGATQREHLPIPLTLPWHLLAYRPNVIVSGDYGPRSLLCWAIARITGARFIIWSEEISSSAQGRSRLQAFMRRFLIRRADAFLPWGQPAASYLRSMGVAEHTIYKCQQAIDNDYWVSRARSLDRRSVRASKGFCGRVFLLVGRLVERKGFANFLRAWAKLPCAARSQCMAVIVGSGEQERELRQLANDLRLSNVRFDGAKFGDELLPYYVGADVLVFPSLEDVWGLVVNEALCCGLPVLASKYAGASQELIAGPEADADNLFDPVDIDAFARAIGRWVHDGPAIQQESLLAKVRHATHTASAIAIATAICGRPPEQSTSGAT